MDNLYNWIFQKYHSVIYLNRSRYIYRLKKTTDIRSLDLITSTWALRKNIIKTKNANEGVELQLLVIEANKGDLGIILLPLMSNHW